jgi:crossover junction endodeoxyribonuclease RuvC
VLGIDPGLSDTGYGLVGPATGRPVVLATGVISTPRDLSLEARIELVYEGVDRLLASLGPELVALEDVYTEYRFPRTALLMAHARGVICLAARRRRIDVLALAPGEVKRAVTGHGAAPKEQVQASIQRLLALPDVPRPSHVGDALALAFTGYARLGGRLS